MSDTNELGPDEHAQVSPEEIESLAEKCRAVRKIPEVQPTPEPPTEDELTGDE